MPSFAQATSRTWVGTSGDINTSGNWSPSGVPAGGDVLTFDDTGTTTTVTGNPVADVVVVVNSTSKNYTLSGIYSGTTSITKQGTSTLTLSGANTFGGGLTIKAGTVNLSNSATAAGSGTITIGDTSGSANASLVPAYNFTYTNPITVNSGSSGILSIDVNTTSASRILGGLITLNHDLNVNVGNGYTLILSGGTSGSGGNFTINNSGTGTTSIQTTSVNHTGTITNSGSGSGTTTISAVIGTNVTGVIQNSSTSQLTLSGANTFTSGLTIKAGVVYGTTSANAFGANTSVITIGDTSGSTNATLRGTVFTYANPIAVASGSSGVLTIDNGNSGPTFSGAITLANNLTITNTASADALTITGGITGTGNVILNATTSKTISLTTALINNIGTITNSGAGSGTTTISAVIGTNVTGVIQNSATSQLTLSGANTFTSGLYIMKGTVKGQTDVKAFGSSTAVDSITLGCKTADSATCGTANATLDGSANLNFANPITVASGSNGVLSLLSTGTNSLFDGLITLNSGITLTLTNSGNGGLRISGGTIGTGNIVTNPTSSGGVTLQTAQVNHTGTITNSGTGSGTTTISAAIGTNVTGITQNSATSALTISGTNTYVGPITNSAGTLNLAQTNTFSTMTLEAGTTTTITHGKTITLTNLVSNGTSGSHATINSDLAGSAATLSTASAVISANYLTLQDSTPTQTETWYAGGTSTFVSNTGNWVNTVPPIIWTNNNGTGNNLWSTATNWSTGVVPGAGAIAKLAGTENITINANPTADSISVASNYSGTITLNNSITVSAPIALSANATISVGTGNTATLSGIISGASYGLSKTGAGTLTLSGANTFGGGLTIKAGTVRGQTSTSAFGGSGTGVITLGDTTGSADASLSNYYLSFANPITVASGSSANTLTVTGATTGANTYTGAITLNNNLTITAPASCTINLSGGITGTGNVVLNNTGTTSNFYISGSPINMTGTLTNQGTATGGTTIVSVIGTNVTGVIQNSSTSSLVLSGNNVNFVGGITIKSGILKTQTSANSPGSGTITIGDTSGSANATWQATDVLTYANPITVATGSSGVLEIESGYARLNGLITLNNNLILDNPYTNSAWTVAGGISGTGNIIINTTTSGTITLSTTSINNIGTITHTGSGSGIVTISAVIGTNVTGVIQNSSTSQLTLQGANTWTTGGLWIKKGSVLGSTSTSAFGGSGTGEVIIGDTSGTDNARMLVSTSAANSITVGPLGNTNTGILSIQESSGTPTLSGAITLNHDLAVSNWITYTGGVTGTGNISANINSGAGGVTTFSTNSMNMIGTFTNSGTSSGTTTISAVIGTNVTGILQNSSTSKLVLSGNNSNTGNVTITSGTLELSGTTNLNVSGNWSNSGTFTPNQSTITLTGNGTHTITLGGNSFYNLTVNSGSTVQAVGDETFATHTLSFNSGANAIYTGSGSYTGLNLGNTFNNLTFNGSGTYTLNHALTVNGNLVLQNGTLDVSNSGNYSISIGGNYTDTASGDNFIERTGTVTFTGDGTINTNEPFYGVTVNGSGKTVTLASSLDVNGNLTITAGTLDVSADNRQINLAGDFSNSGTLNQGTGTVILDGGNQLLTGSSNTTFYNITKTVSSPATLTFNHLRTFTIQNNSNLYGVADNLLSLRSDSDGNQFTINVGNTGTRTVRYLNIKDSHNTNATSVLCDTGCVNAGNNTGWIFPVQGIVYATDGTTPLANKTVSLSINGNTIAGSAVANGSGSYSINPGDLQSGDVLTVYLDGNSEKGVTVTITNGTTVDGIDITQDVLTVRHEAAGPITNTTLATADNNGDSDITDFYSLDGSNNLTLASGKNLTVATGSTYTPGGNVGTNDILIKGTFIPQAKTVTVGGSWQNSGGTFTKGTSTVILTATAVKTLTANSQAFNNLSVSGNGGQINLQDGLTVNGQLYIATGAVLDLNSFSFNNNTGTFSNDGTLRMQGGEILSNFTNDPDSGTTLLDGTGTYTSLPTSSYFHLAFNGIGGSWTLAGMVSVGGNLTLTAGTLFGSDKTINLAGNWSDTSNLFAEGTSTVACTGSCNINEGGNFYNFTVDTAGTALLANALNVSNNLTLTQGILDVSANAFAVNLTGNWNKTNGTFNARTGTVSLIGTNQSINGDNMFYNLTKETGDATLTFQAGKTQTVINMWTTKGTSGHNLLLRSSADGVTQWKISAPNYTLQYVDVKDSNNVGAGTILASNDAINSGNNTAWAFPLVVTVYSDEGVTKIGSGKTVSISVNGQTKKSNTTNGSSVATFNDDNVNHTIAVQSGDILTMWLDDNAEKAVTVTVTNGTSLSFNLYQDRLILQYETGSQITNASLDTANNAIDSDIDAIYTTAGNDLTVQSGKELFIKQGTTFVPGGKVNTHDIDINGTFTMAAHDVTVSGSWDATGGTFTGTNTVTFTSSDNETITSNGNQFYNTVFQTNGDTKTGKWDTTDRFDVLNRNTMTITSGSGQADTTPPVISSIIVTAGESAATISWTTSESADSKLESGTGDSLGTSNTDTSLTLRHAITLSNLSPETKYYYKVTSKDSSSNSASSDVATFTTLKSGTTSDTLAPSISGITVTDVTSAGATIGWTTDEDATSYVDYGDSSTFNRSAGSGTGSSVAKSNTATLTGLSPSTKYYYRIVAIDVAGNKTSSEDRTFTTLAEDSAVQASDVLQESGSRTSSDAPKLSSDAPAIIDITGTTVKVTWNTDKSSTSVVYYRELGSKDNPLKMGDPSYVKNHEVTLVGLKDATSYEYSVESKDPEGNTMQSKRYEFTTRLPKVKNVSVQNIAPASARFVYVTETATPTIIELTNILTGETINVQDDSIVMEHKVALDNLAPDNEYSAVILVKGAQDQVQKSLAYVFRTQPDTMAPVLSTIETRSALVEGEKDKVQTIISWITDEAATSQVEYNEGLTRGGKFKNATVKSEDYVTKHVVVLPDLQPSTVYEYRVKSSDRSKQEIVSEPRVLLTPQRRVSAFDLIVRNLEDTFGWTNQIGK